MAMWFRPSDRESKTGRKIERKKKEKSERGLLKTDRQEQIDRYRQTGRRRQKETPPLILSTSSVNSFITITPPLI